MIEGVFIVWQNYGCEGWHPTKYTSLKEAILGERHTTDFIITKQIDFEITEIDPFKLGLESISLLTKNHK